MLEGQGRPGYTDIGVTDYKGSLDDRQLSLIPDRKPAGELHGNLSLLDVAVVIRSKDAGVNRLTFDILFNSGEHYAAGLRSNVFHKGNIAKILMVPEASVVGTFFVDSCNAIKISVDRPNISAPPDERDVFGAQQPSALERLSIPVDADPLSRASGL